MWHWLLHLLMLLIIVVLSVDGLTFCWVRRVYQIFYRINYRIGGYLLLVDLDGLKEINDRFGHKKGDQTLRQLGRILMFASFLKAFRYGGDEFIILTFSKSRKRVERLIDKIESEACQLISFSYGIGKNEEEADKGMYEMKAKHYKDREL